LAIAIAYREAFSSGGVLRLLWEGFAKNRDDDLHDFLFERGYPPWACTEARFLEYSRVAQNWIMNFHTGRSTADAMRKDTVEEQQRVGRQFLQRLAEDILTMYHDWPNNRLKRRLKPTFARLLRRLELDGYAYKPPRLHAPENDVIDTREEKGVLEDLYDSLALANKDVAQHCLEKAEQFWMDGDWDECIGNARRYLEAVMREVAAAHSLHCHKAALDPKEYVKAESVRQYLRKEGLVELKEEELLRVFYGLLSNTGNHPYIAKQDQARLLYRQALLLTQFVMLRYQGYLKSP
jgi:hypothetical protein